VTSAQSPGAGIPVVPSYASGISDTPLLGDTIGDNFDRTAAAHPDVDALVEVQTGRRWTYVECCNTSLPMEWVDDRLVQKTTGSYDN